MPKLPPVSRQWNRRGLFDRSTVGLSPASRLSTNLTLPLRSTTSKLRVSDPVRSYNVVVSVVASRGKRPALKT
jgi:hypothetical protein